MDLLDLDRAALGSGGLDGWELRGALLSSLHPTRAMPAAAGA